MCGKGYVNKPLNVRVACAAPSEPLSAEVHVLSDGSAHVAWKPPLQPNGVILYYNIHYTTRPELPLTQWTTAQHNGEFVLNL